MLGYSKIRSDIFTFSETIPQKVEARTRIDSKLLKLGDMTSTQWRQLKKVQGTFSVTYLKYRYGSPSTYLLLAYVGNKLAHVEWIVPAKRIKGRYPFLTDNTYFIISCLTSPDFRGLRIYPSQLRHVVESEIQTNLYWGMAACDNVPSIKGIYRAGGIKVGESVQTRWFWGLFSRLKYFPLEKKNYEYTNR
ncbi:MAG: hypothetical protein ACYSUL_05845 [Planctomycetota bacterium]|jgi:hypothetical protein